MAEQVRPLCLRSGDHWFEFCPWQRCQFPQTRPLTSWKIPLENGWPCTLNTSIPNTCMYEIHVCIWKLKHSDIPEDTWKLKRSDILVQIKHHFNWYTLLSLNDVQLSETNTPVLFLTDFIFCMAASHCACVSLYIQIIGVWECGRKLWVS